MDAIKQMISDDYEKYVMQTYPRADIAFVRGEGAYLWDTENNRYLDFAMGIAVCNLGHAHPRVAQAVCAQAQRLVHVSNLYMNEKQGKLAKVLIENSFDGVCFFCNSGAEANEGMIKMARRWGNETNRNHILVMQDSFHGRTLATLAATGRKKYREGFEPDMQGFTHVPFNNLEALKAALRPDTCAVMLEVIQGEGGVLPAQKNYIQGVRQFCDDHNLMLLIDEVQTGMGRTGKLFAYQHYDIIPDAFSLAKGIANGFPMGAFIAQRQHAQILKPGMHASTFGGTPLACAAALATLDVLLDGALENCQKQSNYFFAQLEAKIGSLSCVQAIRGKGLMVGIVLDRPAAPLLALLRREGLLVLAAGETVLRLLPMLLVTQEQIDDAVAIIEKVLKTLK